MGLATSCLFENFFALSWEEFEARIFGFRDYPRTDGLAINDIVQPFNFIGGISVMRNNWRASLVNYSKF